MIRRLSLITTGLLLSACMHKGPNPIDPYESYNRKVHNFNMAFDATFLRPPARLYKAVVPARIRMGITNAFMNIDMIPTVANDILQADWRYTIKDSWRFFINSTFGIAGLIDVATTFGLPPHSNDLGLTFAKWGDKSSPYFVIPFLGPSTIRDASGLLFEYPILTPYSYFIVAEISYGLVGLRYLDVRSQLLEAEKLMHEALDPYIFIRDAYIQNRNFRINGLQPGNNANTSDAGSLYVEE